MRIKFQTSVAGMNYNHKPGDEVEWPDDVEAKRFIAAGYASDVTPPPSKLVKTEKADGKKGGEDADADTAKKSTGKGGSKKADGKNGDEDADAK